MSDFDKLPEFTGIMVYDRETGKPVTAKDICPYCTYNDWLVADNEGLLVIPFADKVVSYWEVPKDKYIIQVNGEYYRW
jgi:hypothetical protein